MPEDKYICDYCGAEYDSPAARACCELDCDEKKAEAERERRRKPEAERQV